MLGFPIAGPRGEFDVLLFGDRDPLLSEGGRLPFISACRQLLPPNGSAVMRGGTFHGARCTRFFLLCPVLSSRGDGLTEYLLADLVNYLILLLGGNRSWGCFPYPLRCCPVIAKVLLFSRILIRPDIGRG
jgi:hypothetical protein